VTGELVPGRWVYASVPAVPAGCTPVVTVREAEGTTVVVPEHEALALGLPTTFVASMITLQVHSALDAVGLTAAVSTVLADAGIPCNVVAGFHHDHLFVPADLADEVVSLLRARSER
jgi:hypothetical protein